MEVSKVFYRKFQGSFKEVSTVFHRRLNGKTLKGDLREFHGNLKEV